MRHPPPASPPPLPFAQVRAVKAALHISAYTRGACTKGVRSASARTNGWLYKGCAFRECTYKGWLYKGCVVEGGGACGSAHGVRCCCHGCSAAVCTTASPVCGRHPRVPQDTGLLLPLPATSRFLPALPCPSLPRPCRRHPRMPGEAGLLRGWLAGRGAGEAARRVHVPVWPAGHGWVGGRACVWKRGGGVGGWGGGAWVSLGNLSVLMLSSPAPPSPFCWPPAPLCSPPPILPPPPPPPPTHTHHPHPPHHPVPILTLPQASL